MKIDQVCIGSCTNSSLSDMLTVAAMLKGKTIHPDVSLSISPGSKQVYTMMAECGALADLISAGARILECACGPCIGMGFSPKSGGISLRTFNRNFLARSGTADAGVYLVSPETAAASAIAGVFTDPREMGEAAKIEMPKSFLVNDNLIEMPADPESAKQVTVERGPNIKPIPKGMPPAADLECELILKVGDNITTDHIMPAGAKILPYRSNVPKLSEFCFTVCDPEFPERAKARGGGVVLGGLLGMVFGEKVDKRFIISCVLVIAGTICLGIL
jgi:aconitate hydratase